MKRIFFAALFAMSFLTLPLSAPAQTEEEPVIYVIEKGDTLWGLSDRFLKDPFYWPDLWARNPVITNPHLIYPGQKVRVYSDRIEIEPAPVAQAPAVKPPVEEVAPERTFLVNGAEGFLLEKRITPAGHIVATHNDRNMVGENDLVYTDIGRTSGAKRGNRLSIFKEMETVKHPVTHAVVGYRVASLGTLRLSEIKAENSKAIITRSYQEIGRGSYLMPYRDRRRSVSLKAAGGDLNGYIVSTRHGIISVGAGDIVYLDLGRKQGLQTGNLLYVVRDINPDKLYTEGKISGALPKDVIGALVIVEMGENTSTALIIKSVEDIRKGDKVELRKS